MRLMVETELLYKSLTTLLHGSVYEIENLRNLDTLTDGLTTLHLAHISSDCMTGIQCKELPLDISQQIVSQVHTVDLRCRAYKRLLLHIPLIILLHSDIDRIFASDRRNDTVYGTVRKSDMLRTPCRLRLIQMRKHCFLQTRRRHKSVFTCNNIKRGFNACFFTCNDSFSDGRSDKLKNSQANRSRNEFSLFNFLHHSIGRRIHSADTGNKNILTVDIFNMNGILSVGIDPVDKVLDYICEHYLIAGFSKNGSNESTADISGPKLNCKFHFINYLVVFGYPLGIPRLGRLPSCHP